MPEKKYMLVDPRFDHGMRIPAPAISAKIGAPDACTGCHIGKSSEWAENRIRAHFGPAKPAVRGFAQTLAEARAGNRSAVQELVDLIKDSSRPAIVRATAAQEIEPYLNADVVGVLEKSLSDRSPGLRAAIVEALEGVPIEVKVRLIVPLLADPVLGVRIEAARVLASVPQSLIPQEHTKALEDASTEYLESQALNGESPQAQVNIGVFYAIKGMIEKAEKAYRVAIELERQFVPAYVNLADLFRHTGRDKEAIPVLEQAIQAVPANAEAHFALGLLLVRLGEKQKAIGELHKAVMLQPDNAYFTYVHIVALNDLGRKKEARELLASSKRHFSNSAELSQLEIRE